MIKKILNIRQIGRFRAFGNGQNNDLAFAKNTFIFGNNTHGKSTFTAILRSLFTQNPDFIIGRKTFSTTDPQEVCIEMDNGDKISFKDGAWSNKIKLAIFDRYFICENVFVGEDIDDEKQGRIAGIILGKQGYQLKKDFEFAEAACAENSNAKRKITDGYKKTTEAQHMSDFEAFRKILQDPDIDAKINANKRGIEAFDNRGKICAELEKISQKIAVYQGKTFEQDLATTLEIEQDKIREHITHNLSKHEGVTRFFELGFSFLKEKYNVKKRPCPFCSQEMDIEAESLMDAYSKYFSQSYRDLLTKLKNAISFFQAWGIQNFLTERVSELQKLTIVLDIEAEKAEIEKSQINFQKELERKNDLNYEINFNALEILESQFASILVKVNQLKARYCATVSKEELEKLKTEKKNLEIIKKRHQSPYKEICDEYGLLEEEFKKTLKPAKDKAFDARVKYSKEIFKEYEKRINIILEKLGANFKLVDLKPDKRQKGGNHSLFSLQFFNDASANVKLSGAEHEWNFKNSLSDSDKRVLAFAFFMAQLQSKNDLSNYIVVLDDPMSSFDVDRKIQTLKMLRDQLTDRNGIPARQLIILTHEEKFLALGHELISEEVKFLRISYLNSSRSSAFLPCDVNEEFLKENYFKEIERLRNLLDTNEEEISAQDLNLIRRCMEHIMKRKYYLLLQEEIKQGGSISAFIEKLKSVGIYNDALEREIQDLLPHNPHHDQSNEVCVSGLTPQEIKDIITNFFEVLKKL